MDGHNYNNICNFVSDCILAVDSPPYMRCEKMTDRFLDGYIFSEKEDMELLNLTPSIQKQMKMVDRIVRSPQYMDLNKRQAQYLALQNQINPHFLYNTLESIRGEAIIAGLDSVADMTEALARFFRYTITKVENLVSVEEELDNCETYFGIQKYRFGDRLQLHIDYDIAEYEKIMNCRIPKLTLQRFWKQHYPWRGAEGWRWKFFISVFSVQRIACSSVFQTMGWEWTR